MLSAVYGKPEKMNQMDKFDCDKCRSVTLSYYETWLGEPGCLTDNKGSRFVYSTERNAVQTGYSSQMDVYIWVQHDRTVVSYGDKVKEKIRDVDISNNCIHTVSDYLRKTFGGKVSHCVKYVYGGAPAGQNNNIKTKTLTADDYGDFERFFNEIIPADNSTWLPQYFYDIAAKNFCAGVYADGILASCTDAASMPYMADKLQEIGINTLEAYRGRGYAAAACRKAAENILNGGRFPVWSHDVDNEGSRRLAESIGFIKLGDVIMLTV